MSIRAAILTVSDKGSRGEREDRSGAEIRAFLADLQAEIMTYAVVPDERETIAARLSDWRNQGNIDLVFTTGGTGLGPRDVTPEATLSVVERLVPGLPELMRAAGFQHTPLAYLSRGVAGIAGRMLVINLPGSPKAVRESLAAIQPVLPHALEILRGAVTEHSQSWGEGSPFGRGLE